MKENRCCFAGHSNINVSNVTEKIKQIAEILIKEHSVTEFWVGNYGAFDKYAAKAVRDLKNVYPVTLELVIPYLTKEINESKQMYYENYDNILIADIPEKTPLRYYIIKANEYMINSSSFMICYVNKSGGGARRTYEYAKRKEIKIFNLEE